MSEPGAVDVLFIHGLWMHASSWGPWLELCAERGYAPIAPGWPGDSTTVEQTRADPGAMNGVGIGEITAHYADVIAELPRPPIVIGHSFGGLIAQRLLGMQVARACVALAPAQFRGILGLPLAQLESALPVLGKPWLRKRTWSHNRDSYAKNFANGVSRQESDDLYDRFTIPAPCRPLFQAGFANLSLHSEATVDTKAARGPLLLVAGNVDRTVPASTVRAAFDIQRKNAAVTEFEVLDKRGHSFPADSGWRAAADLALAFLERNALSA
jgi:pimeloyl-ACP methyl ester carboxylesterase